ncbi:MAG: succinate dehydrogenase, cytochrome b556 subunit, partial [Mycobacterium sp.]
MSTQATAADPAGAQAASTPSRKRRPPRTLYRGDPGMWSWVLHRI